MNYILSIVAAASIALMLVPNGQLTDRYDVYASTFIIHLVGLMAVTIIMLIKKEKFRLAKNIPWFLYTGGLVGVATTMLSNLSYGKISISAMLALSLLGQTVTSLVIDHFGLFHMEVQKVSIGKIVGFLFTICGIIFIFDGSAIVALPIIFSSLSGASIVISRSINAEIAEKSSVWASTWYNYFVGLMSCSVIWVGAVLAHKSTFAISVEMNPWIYTGGLISVIAVSAMNVVTKKMPAFILTLIMFVGQLFTGMIIDKIQGVEISMTYVAGGVLTVFGLALNLYMDYRKKNKKQVYVETYE